MKFHLLSLTKYRLLGCPVMVIYYPKITLDYRGEALARWLLEKTITCGRYWVSNPNKINHKQLICNESVI